jgi:hypothetical protein
LLKTKSFSPDQYAAILDWLIGQLVLLAAAVGKFNRSQYHHHRLSVMLNLRRRSS